MKFTSNYQKDSKSGTHLHNNIKAGSDFWNDRFKDVGALVCTKGQKVTVTIEGLSYVTKRNQPTGWTKFNREFTIGDYVEYDSYNLIYTGKITKIGPKSITIDDMGTIKRMDLFTFIYKNWDLDLDKISAKNADTRYYI